MIRSSVYCTLIAMSFALSLWIRTSSVHAEEPSADVDIDSVVGLLELLIDVDPDSAAGSLDVLVQGVQNRTLSQQQLTALQERVGPLIAAAVTDDDSPLHRQALLLATSWGEKQAAAKARAVVTDTEQPVLRRAELLQALSTGSDPQFVEIAGKLIAHASETPEMAVAALDALSSQSSAAAIEPVLQHYSNLPAELQPKAIELLTGRPAWSIRLLERIGDGSIPKNALNANQIAKLQTGGDEALRALVLKNWGRVRTERNPERERVVAQMRDELHDATGDPVRGREVFHKVCGQCHKIFGRGHDVGPDITGNGRSTFEQLLSNVFDPSLVIGESYQARTVLTVEGKVLTGLLAEQSERQVVLKTQGGKVETIPTDEIEEMRISQLSLMPEGLEKQLKPQELADLFAFVTLTADPDDPAAVRIPGAPTFLGK